MSKKNTVFSLLALVVAAAALVVSLSGHQTATPDYAPQIQALEEKNAQLQSRLDALSAQLSATSTSATLVDWSLSLTPWEANSGASVTLTAVPSQYEEGMAASFYVRKGSVEVVTVACDWTGEAFTATAELTAQDGYSYYCILETPEGRQQLALTTPENPVEDIPVYLATALNAYCNLTLDSWLDQDNTLTVVTAYVQAQLPQLTADGNAATIEKAALSLKYQEQIYSSADITLDTGSGIGVGAYEHTVTDVALAMPQMAEDECLELWLEVTLSDGQVLSSLGASWFQGADELFAVVG